MPELKHGFGAAKMNKDADERIVPNGEYRDALNIEIVTSEGSDVGSMQTLLGNDKITNSEITTIISNTAKCVGSIADEKNNHLYYFIQDDELKTDYIFQYNSDTKDLIPVVVDKYEIDVTASQNVNTTPADIKTHFIISGLGGTENITNARVGMTIEGSFLITVSGNQIPLTFTHNQGLKIIKIKPILPASGPGNDWQIFLDETIVDLNLFDGGITSFITQTWNLKADRVLNFEGNQITGINIIDGVIYWTDGSSEPKKIVVDDFIKNIIPGKQGTATSGELHSFFNVYDQDNVLIENNHTDFRIHPAALAEEHVTVIKKSPLYPPTLLMSNTSDGRLNSSGPAILTSTIDDYFIDFNADNLEVGTIKNITFDNAVDYLVGDLVLLRRDTSFDSSQPDLDRFDLIVEILEPLSATYVTKIKINWIDPTDSVNSLINPGAVIDPSNPPEAVTFYSMLQQEKPLYEFKFPRFAYRYKYKDNQYSTYSPFSEPAFLPGNFGYIPKEGYNLGMVNTLRSIYIMDFVTDEDAIPKDVIEIDILYKESNSTNIYTVKTIKYGDDEWIAKGSPINTLSNYAYARTTGAIQITSELVRAAVSSNQLLRPWDNVPRAATAQEIIGNRIVYANYLQNYNL